MIPKLHVPFRGNFPITFPFGSVPDDRKLKRKFLAWDILGHHGIDFGLPEGTNVYSCSGGTVVHAGRNGDFGVCVIVKHRWGESWYAHLKKANVKKNGIIKRGQLIGWSGKTGNATGPHLHFAIKPQESDVYNGYLGFIDPALYLWFRSSLAVRPRSAS